MPDAVEVAIQSALLNRLGAMVLTPAVPVALPNVPFTPPVPGQNAAWLRGTILPADSIALSVDYGSENQHFGIFQVDIFYGIGSGALAPGRIADAVLAWFRRGTRLTKDGFTVEVTRVPWVGQLIDDDPWVMIPVSVPYLAFAVST